MDFENLEIRKVANGFVVTVTTEEDTNEYVFDTSRRALRFVREQIEGKKTA